MIRKLASGGYRLYSRKKDKSGKRVEGSLARLSDAYSGRKIIQDATLAAKAVDEKPAEEGKRRRRPKPAASTNGDEGPKATPPPGPRKKKKRSGRRR